MAWLLSNGGACGSTIVNARSLLTAAHCVQGISRATVRPGCNNLNNCVPRTVRSWQQHPNYDFPNNDVAILRLQTPFGSFSDSIRPVCLPAPGTSRPGGGTTATIAGWGRNDPNTQSISFNLKEATIRWSSRCFEESAICTTRVTGNTCNGDSGGFMGFRVNGRWTQFGVTSFGTTRNCVGGTEGFAETTNDNRRNLGTWIHQNI